jgi:hypothetical protein
MEITTIIIETMKKAKKPLSSGQIAEMAKLEKKDVEKGMKILKDTDKIESPKRCYWQPKI